MSSQFYFKCLVTVAIAIPIFGLPSETSAQIHSDILGDSKDYQIIERSMFRGNLRTTLVQNHLSSPWSNAALIHTLESPSAIDIIKFSPDGIMLATVESSQIKLWNTGSGKIERILHSYQATQHNLKIAPTAIAFSPDSRFLATATWSQGLLSPKRSLMVWDVATGEKALQLKESAGCRQVLFDRSGEILYAACELGVTAWSFPQGDKLFNFDVEYPVEAIALSHDGKIMATVDANTKEQQTEKSDRIQLWKLDEEKPTLLKTLDGHDNDIAKVEFTADDKKLVSSSYDGKINVWNWQAGKIERKTNNLNSSNGLFSLSANSRLIAGNFYSSAMTSLVTGLPLRNVMTILNKKETKLMAFSPQGEMFAAIKQSPSNRDRIYLWQNNPQRRSQKATLNAYLKLDISEYWDTQLSAEETNSNPKPSAIGSDPQAIALAALGLTEIIESETEEVEVDYPQEDIAVVTVTQTNLLDDSVAGIRYQVKFAPYSNGTAKLWQVVSAGQQFKCYRDRGHQHWSQDFCS